MQHPMIQHIAPSISPMIPWCQKSLMVALMPVVLILYAGLPQASTSVAWNPIDVDVDAITSGSVQCPETQTYSPSIDPSHQNQYYRVCDRLTLISNTAYIPINPSAPKTGSINGMR